jgi:hypothetical protein
VAIAGLAIFHLCLLWGRLATATIQRPNVAFRWAAAAGLLFGVHALHRRAPRIGDPRVICALAIVAALLHAPPSANKPMFVGAPPSLLLVAGCGMALGVATVAGTRARLAHRVGRLRSAYTASASCRPGFAPALTGRAPPSAPSRS